MELYLMELIDKKARIESLEQRISIQPTIDAVPAIRCKECLYLIEISGTIGCVKHRVEVESDYYCADGEKRKVILNEID